MQVHRRGFAGGARPRPEPDHSVHVGVVSRQGHRREVLHLHRRAERREELGDSVLAVTHAVPGAAVEVVSAAQSTSLVTASRIAATSPRPNASYTRAMVLTLASSLTGTPLLPGPPRDT